MNKIGQIRIRISEILNELFGDYENEIIFRPENTIKSSGGTEKSSKCSRNNSVNWIARCNGKLFIVVHCIGMTMTEFIKEYNNKNILIFKTQREIGIEYSLYINCPTWKTSGYLLNVDLENNILKLKINDIIDPVELPITKNTPRWLFEEGNKFEFTCKIYPFWRMNNLHLIQNSDLSKVWKTFKLKQYLSDYEY